MGNLLINRHTTPQFSVGKIIVISTCHRNKELFTTPPGQNQILVVKIAPSPWLYVTSSFAPNDTPM